MGPILIIDDDADIRLLVLMLLESAGFSVAEAACGTDGLAYLAEHGASCVLLDINMPTGMNGYEVCRRIKADPTLNHTPVVMLTVRSMLRDREEIEEARPDGFVNKPFSKDERLQAIREVLPTATGG